MYDPTQGRFLSEDPTGFAAGDANLYRYVRNSAVNYVDPTGLVQAGNPLDTLGGGFAGGVGALRLDTFDFSHSLNLSQSTYTSTYSTHPSFFGGGTSTPFSLASPLGFEQQLPLSTPAFSSSYNTLPALGSALWTGVANATPSMRLLGATQPFLGAGVDFAAMSNLMIPANGDGGHHWVPQAVVNQMAASLPREARDVFRQGTSGPLPYVHRFDTWSDVTHSRYSSAVASLLQSQVAAAGANYNKTHASELVTFLETGAHKVSDEKNPLSIAIAKEGRSVDVVRTWRAGFQHSLQVAEGAAAKARELGATLSPRQLKAIAQQEVNGRLTTGVARHYDAQAKRVHEAYNRLPVAAKRKLLASAAKKALGVVSALTLTNAAQAGWKGNNPHGWTGLAGAYAGFSAEFTSKELVESAVVAAADGIFNGILNFEEMRDSNKKTRSIEEAAAGNGPGRHGRD